MSIKPKKQGLGLEMKTFEGKDEKHILSLEQKVAPTMCSKKLRQNKLLENADL